MTESPTYSPSTGDTISAPDQIPIEIIADEEMALIEAAFASATRTLFPPLTQFQRNAARSIKSITLLSKKRISCCSGSGSDSGGDIEDSGGDGVAQKKRNCRVNDSLLHRFRRNRGLSMTDITGAVLFFVFSFNFLGKIDSF